MDSLDKINQEYIKRRIFEEDSECIEDITIGYSCLFFSLILFVAILLLVLIYKFTE